MLHRAVFASENDAVLSEFPKASESGSLGRPRHSPASVSHGERITALEVQPLDGSRWEDDAIAVENAIGPLMEHICFTRGPGPPELPLGRKWGHPWAGNGADCGHRF